MISSAANPLIRLAAAVLQSHRRAVKEGLCAVEGLRLAEMAAASRWSIRHALMTERAAISPRGRALRDALCARGAAPVLIAENIAASLSETETPQGILLLAERHAHTSLAALHDGLQDGDAPLYIALDRVQDPGNVGTIIRTADAAGASGIILLRGCADAYSGKVVRATMGALFSLPFAEGVTAAELADFARGSGLTLCAAACDAGARTHFSADLCRPLIVVFGNEANGVSEELLRVSEHIYIPMRGSAESLNVAAAAAAVLYEAMRQRCYGEHP